MMYDVWCMMYEGVSEEALNSDAFFKFIPEFVGSVIPGKEAIWSTEVCFVGGCVCVCVCACVCACVRVCVCVCTFVLCV